MCLQRSLRYISLRPVNEISTVPPLSERSWHVSLRSIVQLCLEMTKMPRQHRIRDPLHDLIEFNVEQSQFEKMLWRGKAAVSAAPGPRETWGFCSPASRVAPPARLLRH